MTIQVQVINAFTVEGRGGNPAGVVFDADKLSIDLKQAIATKAGFPETAFVSASTVADFKLDFFTPTRQIPHCGHATIATFSYLKSIGKIAGNQSSKETIDGCRTILFNDGMAFMEQKPPTFEFDLNRDEVINSLQLTANDLMQDRKPAIVNTGNSFLIVPIKYKTILSRVQYNREAVYRLSEQFGLIGFYLYTYTSDFDATTRMFAPFYGIDEEAGTGMAAGPLAAYLREVDKPAQTRFRIEQGRFMKPVASASLIQVDLDVSRGKIIKLFAGGGANISKSVIVTV